MPVQELPTLDERATLDDAVRALKRLGDPAAARTVQQFIDLLPAPSKSEAAILRTHQALITERGRWCLHCHMKVNPADKVPSEPQGYAHRECEALYQARKPRPCRECDGTGDYDGCDTATRDEHQGKCPACGGSGKSHPVRSIPAHP